MSGRKTILIADDSLENRSVLTSALEQDYNIEQAQSRADTFELLWKKAETINGVVLDIDMCIEGGFDILIEMHNDEKYHNIPVVIISAEHDPELEAKALDLGAAEFILSPVNPLIAKRRIAAVIEQSETERTKLATVRLSEQLLHRRQLNEILETISCGVAIYEVTGGNIHCRYFNQPACSLLNYTKEEYPATIKNDYLANIYVQDREAFRSLIMTTAVMGKSFDLNVRCVKKNSDLIWIRIVAQYIRQDDETATFLVSYIDIDKEMRFAEELRIQAQRDRLTGIYNKERFYERTTEMLRDNPQTQYVLIRWNVERFKLINELFGKEKGDYVLKRMGDKLLSTIGEDAIYGRLEADHFAVCCPIWENAEETIEKDLKIFNSELDEQFSVTTDAGVYVIDDRNIPVHVMCDRANLALRTINGIYDKHVAFYNDDMRLRLLAEQEIRDDMHAALENREFQVYLQPIYSATTGAVISAEALVRWIHPGKGLISPNDFIPLFEENGFISELDYYVWDEVCHILRRRRKEGHNSIPISVNASRKSLYNPNLCKLICDLTEEHGVRPDEFKIEITETAYTDNPAQLSETINSLRKYGFPVLMDDFGSGYSSLNTLKDIHVDILKIDMKFLEGFEKGGRVGTILTSVLRMAKWLNLPVIAEGVETMEQVDYLRSIGCEAIQGFYFSKPVPYSNFESFVAGKKEEPNVTIPNYSHEEIDELMGGNRLINKMISGVFGGLSLCELTSGELKVIRVNSGYYNIMGYNEQSIGTDSRNMLDNVFPDDRQRLVDACLESRMTGAPSELTIRRYHSDGHIMRLECICTCLGIDETSQLFCVAFSDLTEKDEKNHHLRAIMSSVGCGIVLYRLDGTSIKVVYANDEYYTQNGYSKQEAEQMNSLDLVHPDDKAELLAAVYALNDHGTPIDLTYRIIRKDGSIKWTQNRSTLYTDTLDGQTLAVSVLTDVSANKKTLELFNCVTKCATMGITLFKVENNISRIEFSNDAYYRILGYTKAQYNEEIINTFDSIYPDDLDRLIGYIGLLSSESESAPIEYRAIKRDKTVIYLRASAIPMPDSVSNKHALMTIISDITEEKLAERNKQIARYSDLLYGIFDEISCADFNADVFTVLASTMPDLKNSIGLSVPLRKTISDWIERRIHPDDKQRMRDVLDDPSVIKLKNSRSGYMEYRIVTAGGETKWIALSAMEVGTKTLLFCTLNITARKEAELLERKNVILIQQLYDSEKYRLLVEQSDTAVLEWNVRDDKYYFSESFDEYEISRLRPEELAETEKTLPLVHEDDKEEFLGFCNRIKTETPNNESVFRLRTTDGAFRWVRANSSCVLDESGNPARIVSSVKNVDEEIKAKRLAEETADRLSHIVENVPAVISIHTVAKKIKLNFVSNKIQEALGYSPEEYVRLVNGGKLNAVIQQAGFNVDSLKNAAGKPPFERTLTIAKKDGTNLDVRIISSVIVENGAYVCYSATQDISEQLALDREQKHRIDVYSYMLDATSTLVFDYDASSDTMIYSRTNSYGKRVSKERERGLDFIEQGPFHHHSFARDMCDMLKEAGKKETEGTYEFLADYDKKGFRWYRAFYRSVPGKTGKMRVVGTITDIDESKRSEQAYEEYIAKLSVINPKVVCNFRMNLTQNRVGDGFGHYPSIMELRAMESVDGFFGCAYNRFANPIKFPEITAMLSCEKLLDKYSKGQTEFSFEHRFYIDDSRIEWLKTYISMMKNPKTGDVEAIVYSLSIDENKRFEELVGKVTQDDYDYLLYIDLMSRMVRRYDFSDSISGKQLLTFEEYENFVERRARKSYSGGDLETFIERTKINNVKKHLDSNDGLTLMYFYTENGVKRCKKGYFRYLDNRRNVICFSRVDITDIHRRERKKQKQLTEALSYAEKAGRERSEFLIGVSHDIRTPISSIIGLAGMTKEKADDKQAVLSSLRKIETAGIFTQGVINDMIYAAAPENTQITLKKEPFYYFEFLDILDTVITPICESKNISLTFDKGSTSVAVLVDKTRFTQLFFNLLTNAIRFTPSGGHVEYRVFNNTITGNTLSCDFVIRDDGVGMSEEFQKHMFEPFEKENRSTSSDNIGAGLGLTIVQRVVKAMGGTIAIKSEEGKGTEVTLHLDMQIVETNANELSNGEEPLKGKRILYAEDNDITAGLLKEYLEQKGVDAVRTANGKELLNAFESEKESYFDAIITDLSMPVMNGWNAIKSIREVESGRKTHIPVIVLSGSQVDEDKLNSEELNISERIEKPVCADKLYALLTELTQTPTQP